MDATDFVLGIILIAILAWISLIALNQIVMQNSITDAYLQAVLNKPLISLEDVCPEQSGFELVKPNSLEIEPFHVLVGVNDFNQTWFCFYKSVE